MKITSFEEFTDLATRGTFVPVCKEIMADLLTPVSAFLKIAEHADYAFLLESVEGGEHVGRYSFLGKDPFLILRARDGRTTIERGGATIESDRPFVDTLRGLMTDFRSPYVPDLPRFTGGAVGYLGYGAASWFEPVLGDLGTGSDGADQAGFMVFDTVLAFDHVQHRILIIANARITADDDLESLYGFACAKIQFLERELDRGLSRPQPSTHERLEIRSNHTREQFEAQVRTAKEHIAAGDIYQVVLSQRFETDVAVDPFTVYRALRHVNPSPYMYFIRMGAVSVVGSSPEMLVRVEGTRVETHPIAGTRPRGRTTEEDARLGEELKRNEKERAEHVMLVDLGRNDVGRVCTYGSVHVPQFMNLERFSHVMHLTSIVEGHLADDHDRLDALVSCFPAGTVSGAPKVRAMQIIRELEPSGRGLYAGAVGYLDFAGNLDFCIAIRTVIMSGHKAYVQAGAGIVMDSSPAAEYEETRDKARALLRALELAQGDSNFAMVIVIDNYDSFTYNLVQYLGELGAEPRVIRNDAGTVEDVAAARPDRIVISPGPGRPEDAGMTMDIIRRLGQTTPILGVCLGHQAIGAVFGGSVIRATVPMHGKTSTIEHDGRGVFTGIKGPFVASRYHSLVVADAGLPADLVVSARTREDNTIMGLRHRSWPVHGVQFHPESILTSEGKAILRNFLERRSMNFPQLIDKLTRHEDLTTEEAAAAMAEVMEGRATPAQLAGLLIGLAMKGERPSEIVGLARTMRAHAVRLSKHFDDVFDTCGTGGDQSGTFNISTCAAIVVAACGVRVAKHGNRSVSSRSGSADVFEALGVRVSASPATVERCLAEAGIGFFFAPTFHPAMRHAAQARKELGVRTAFNLLGPLTNPAGATRQLVGVPRPEFTELMARALVLLGVDRAWVVHGADGIDEISTASYTKISECRHGTVNTFYLHPGEVGLAKSSPQSLKGGDATENAGIIERILAGEDGPKRDVVLLNAGAALFVAGATASVQEGIARARSAIDRGDARHTLARLVAISTAEQAGTGAA